MEESSCTTTGLRSKLDIMLDALQEGCMILGALVAVVNQGDSAILAVTLTACHILIHQNERRKEAGPHRDISWDIHPFCEGLPLLYGRGAPEPRLAPQEPLIPPSLHSHTAVSISSCNISPHRPGPACCDGPCVSVRVYLLRFGERTVW